MIAHYSMNEGLGTTLHDSSGFGHDGVIQGASWTEGPFGSALDFDGAGGHVEIPHSDALDIHGDAMSITAWFSLTEYNDDGAFVFKNSQYFLRTDNQGRLGFMLYKPQWTEVKMSWDDRILDTDWHHAAAVYDGSEMSLYLDGAIVAGTAAAGNIQQRTSDVWIGSQTGGLNQFDGLLDDVRIYDHALSGEAIAAMVPEPGTLALLSIGYVALLHRRRG